MNNNFFLGNVYDLFDCDCVIEYNKLRRLYGVQFFLWLELFVDDVQKWVEYFVINDRIEYDGDILVEKDEGENIVWFVLFQLKC